MLALVGPDTSIDWLCLPRFDSPSVFARLLDEERGGTLGVRAGRGLAARTAAYVRNTNVLRTEVETADGRSRSSTSRRGCRSGLRVDAPIEICRLVRPLVGHAAGARAASIRGPTTRAPASRSSPRARARSARRADALVSRARTCRRRTCMDGSAIRIDRPMFFCAQRRQPPDLDSAPEVENALELTIRGWRAWAKTTRAAVVRAGGGAAIGAVPQAARLQRHRRDHRRRDDQHSRSARLRAHLGLPLLLAARRRVRRRGAAALESSRGGRGVRPLPARRGRQPVRCSRSTASAASAICSRRSSRHLRGFEGVGPVRIGNAAYMQRQHDLMGEMVLCLETILTDPRVVYEDPIAGAAARAARRTRRSRRSRSSTPACGNTARMPRHYTFSKAMCWVAAHRGAELADVSRHARRGAREWGAWADEKRADHPRSRLQRGARLLHAGVRRPVSRRVEPAAARRSA